MTRQELYDKITPCGTLSYSNMVYLLESLVFTDEQIRLALIKRIAQNGSLSHEDWILLAKSITFISGSPINASTIEDWLTGKCNLTNSELKLFLEYSSFRDDSEPTFLLSQNGDFIISETN